MQILGLLKSPICSFRHRAGLCYTSGIFTDARVLNLKDRDDKWHDIIWKNGRNRQRSPCV